MSAKKPELMLPDGSIYPVEIPLDRPLIFTRQHRETKARVDPAGAIDYWIRGLSQQDACRVPEMRGTDPRFTAMDLIVEDGSRVGTVYFTHSEDVVRKAVALPWVSFNTDAASVAPEEVFLNRHVHPRAYGSFTRVLGKYVRDEQLNPMEEAIRKLAALPSLNLRIDRRG